MKSNPTFQTFRTIKATLAISFAVYGAVVLLAGHGAAHHGWCAIAIAVALSLGALHVREYPERRKPVAESSTSRDERPLPAMREFLRTLGKCFPGCDTTFLRGVLVARTTFHPSQSKRNPFGRVCA